MDYSTATPVEIDTELADLNDKIASAGRYIPEYTKIVAEWDAAKIRYAGSKESYQLKLAEMRAEVDRLSALKQPGQKQYDERRWTRFFLVEHVHSNMHCSSFRWNTKIGWLPQLSGMDEAETVDALGEAACTICFPSAPVNKPNTIELDPAKAARKAAAAERSAELAAKRAATAITFADGSPVYDRPEGERYRSIVKTERTAQIEAVDALAAANFWSTQTPDERILRNLAEYKAKFEYILPALAFKSGVDIETKRAELEKKAAKKAW